MQATDIAEVLKRLDAISTDVQEIKLESRVFQAQTTERLESLNQKIDAVETNLTQRIDFTNTRIDTTNQRIESLEKTLKSDTDALEKRLNAQDTRLWGVVVGVTLALFGLLAKLAFFPHVRV